MQVNIFNILINMADPLKAHLQNIAGIEEDTWQGMQGMFTEKRLKRKELFLREGEVCKYIGFILKGYVRLYFLVDGEEVTKDFNLENSFCGSYASFSLQQPSRFNIVAMEDLHLYLINRENLYHLYDTYPAMQKLGRLQMEYMFIRKELRESSFLLDTAEERYRKLEEEQPELLQRAPLKYIASYLGLSPETLSRIRAGK